MLLNNGGISQKTLELRLKVLLIADIPALVVVLNRYLARHSILEAYRVKVHELVYMFFRGVGTLTLNLKTYKFLRKVVW